MGLQHPSLGVNTYVILCWLVVWNMKFMTVHILGRIIPTDFHIFQRGRYTTHQYVFVFFQSWFLLIVIITEEREADHSFGKDSSGAVGRAILSLTTL